MAAHGVRRFACNPIICLDFSGCDADKYLFLQWLCCNCTSLNYAVAAWRDEQNSIGQPFVRVAIVRSLYRLTGFDFTP